METGKWPKIRPQMSEDTQAIYAQNYISNRSGDGAINGITLLLENWMHRQVAKRGSPGEHVLEIGPGNLNHAPYLRSPVWDVVEPYDPLYQEGSDHHHRVRTRFSDISEVPDEAYDRIYSIAVLEHIADLPVMLKRAYQALKPGGEFQAAIPSEGGFLWRLMSWHIKGLFFRARYGADYKEIMRWEHVNTASEIIEEIESVFGTVTVRRFPALGPQLSLYTYVEARKHR